MKAWYYVVLSNNKDAYVLAEDDEEAAWKAVDVATRYNLNLIDVRSHIFLIIGQLILSSIHHSFIQYHLMYSMIGR